MHNTPINIINESPYPLPSYSTLQASGMDIRAFIPTTITLEPLSRIIVPTGLYVEIPFGFELQIRPRSGVAVKQGITCLNSPGTIDADYRGEIKVILINLSDTTQVIETGDRIAQMVLQKVERIEWIETSHIGETVRGDGGLGHTGIK